MKSKKNYKPEELHYLQLLAKQYPTVQAAGTEIVNLQAILNLPKGTEHFISDIHGEYEAFQHILNSCSGVIKEKLDELYGNSFSRRGRDELATLIYYPEEKLELIEKEKNNEDMEEWYRITLHRLIGMCRYVAAKYTRSKVRKSLPTSYAYIINELMNINQEEPEKKDYYENIITSIIETRQADDVITAIAESIKRLAVDHLHIVGDIFDRGPRADIVMDELCAHHSVDVQWGNHDILWMGAARGSRTLVATVLSNSIHYNNLDVIETGYGISLRPLSIFANEVYKDCDTNCFKVKLTGPDADEYTEKDKLLSARMYKAITIILFKLEGQKILRRPEYKMEDRLLLNMIDYEKGTITLKGKEYELLDCDFPTIDPKNPYELTEEESHVIDQLTLSFKQSEKLQKHVRFLYSKGGLYKVQNGNLLYHGSIPMTEEGELISFTIGGKERSGKEFLDYAEQLCRKASYDRIGTPEKQYGLDFMWWLWTGRNSPVFGRDRMTTFERRFLPDIDDVWAEPKNAYYTLYQDPEICDMVLKEFGLNGPHCHIINGHVPVKAKKGESPIKGGGKLIVIDGGFCRAYQPTSGIAGYTLIFDSHNIRIVSHQPFAGRHDAIYHNHDIANDALVFERMGSRMKISETDQGRELQAQINDLLMLLEAYRNGAVTEAHEE